MKKVHPCAGRLLLEPELFDDVVVTLLAFALEILQMRAAVGNHLQEAAAAVLILKMLLEVGGELLYPLR